MADTPAPAHRFQELLGEHNNHADGDVDQMNEKTSGMDGEAGDNTNSDQGSTAGLTAGGQGNNDNSSPDRDVAEKDFGAGAAGAGAGAGAGAAGGAAAGNASAAEPLTWKQKLLHPFRSKKGAAAGGAAAGGAAGAGAAAAAADEVPLTRWQKVKRHFRKWWWAHLIGWAIFGAIFLPILFELIIPAIVQDIVNSQSLPVINGTIRAISPTEIEISLNTSINTNIPARLGTFPLHLYTTNATDNPFANLTIEGQHISKNTPVTVTNQTVPILNQTEIVWWLDQLYEQTTIELDVKAQLDVYLGILHSKPHLDKTLHAPGLNQLSGIHIEGLQFIFPAKDNGYNINGTLVIPNAGVLGIGLGNLSFNLMSGDMSLGLVHLYDVILQPGNTSSFFEGELYFDTLLSNLGPVLQSQSNPLGNGVIQLNATGNSTMINGEHIPYVEGVLNKKILSLDVSVVTLLSDLVSGAIGAGNSSLINALSDVFDNRTFFENVLHNWDPPNFYANETHNITYSRMKKRRTATRESVMWNMLKLGMNMKRR